MRHLRGMWDGRKVRSSCRMKRRRCRTPRSDRPPLADAGAEEGSSTDACASLTGNAFLVATRRPYSNGARAASLAVSCWRGRIELAGSRRVCRLGSGEVGEAGGPDDEAGAPAARSRLSPRCRNRSGPRPPRRRGADRASRDRGASPEPGQILCKASSMANSVVRFQSSWPCVSSRPAPRLV